MFPPLIVLTSDTVSQKAFPFLFPPFWHQLFYRICIKNKCKHNIFLLTRAMFTGRHRDVAPELWWVLRVWPPPPGEETLDEPAWQVVGGLES